MISHSGAQTTFTKADNTTSLSLAASYVTAGGPPGANDTILVDNTLTATSRTSPLGDNLSIKGLTMTAAPVSGAARQFQIGNTAGKVLTIGSDGVTKTANTSPLIFANAVTLGANQTWSLAASTGTGTGNLQMNGLFSDGGHTLAVNGAGIFDLRGSNTFGANVTIDAPVSVNRQDAVVTFGGANTFDVLRIPAGRLIGATLGNFGVASPFGDGGTNSAIGLGGSSSTGVLEYSGLTASSNRTFFRDARTTGSGIDVTQAGQTLTFTGGSWGDSGANGSTDGIANGWAFGGAGNLSINAAINNNTTVGSVAPTVTKKDSGTLTLSGSNAYTGATVINGGVLQSTRNVALDTTASVAVNHAGTMLAVNYGGASDYTAAQVVTLLGKTTFGATSTAFGFDTSNATGAVTYGNALTMAAGFTKLGAGTLILDQTSSYAGATLVNGGTLLINGNISTSSLTTVNTGGTLGGSGTVGSTSVLGGTFAPGNSIDDLNIVGDLTLGPDSFSNFEISATGNLSDLAIVSALLNFGGTLNVSNIAGVLALGNTFNLFDFASKSGNFSSVNLPTLGSGLGWNQENLYTTGEISVIPEPGAALLGGLGLLVLLRRRR